MKCDVEATLIQNYYARGSLFLYSVLAVVTTLESSGAVKCYGCFKTAHQECLSIVCSNSRQSKRRDRV